MKKILMCAVSLAVLGASAAQAKDAKYVFMMIGDGMAVTQRNAAELYMAAMQGKDPQAGIVKLTMDELPIQGMATTYSANAMITDSAAAGTALSTGKKTNSGVINMDPTGKEKYVPLTRTAHDKGYKIGIVTSVSIDHATPATYYAHAAGRASYYDIATQMFADNFEYFAGGAVLEPTGKNKDKPSFYEIAKNNGYTVTQTRADFEALKPGQKRIFAENPIKADENSLPYALDANAPTNKDSISLAEFTKKGIDLLESGKFFMMVEGGKIDWAGHANDAAANIGDTIAFDDAVKVAYDFYKKHPDETLLIVTGDHETGGLTIGFASSGYSTSIAGIGKQKASYIAFTNKFEEMKKANPEMKFEDILPLIQESYGFTLDGLAPYEVEALKASFARAMLPKDQQDTKKDPQAYLLYGTYNPIAMTLNHFVSNKAGLGWTTYSHTGVPVPVSAVGVQSQAFNGFYDNTDIAKKTMKAMGL